MKQAIVSSLPTSVHWVPQSLEAIIDKRICRVSLNVLEKLVDWVCCWVSKSYRSLYNEKMGRVHLLDDNKTMLFDSTKNKVVKIQSNFILISGKRVQTNSCSKYIVVADFENDACEIIDYERPTEFFPNPLPISRILKI